MRTLNIRGAHDLPIGQLPEKNPYALSLLSTEETEFAAMVLAFASPEAQELRSAYDTESSEYLGYLVFLRASRDKVPGDIAEPDVVAKLADAHARWTSALEKLVLQVRAELKTNQRSPWRSDRRRSLIGKLLEVAYGQVPRPKGRPVTPEADAAPDAD